MGTESTGAAIESRSEFEETPEGQYNYWFQELNASQKMVEKWHKTGDNIVQRYLGFHLNRTESRLEGYADNNLSRLNLFHSNTVTLQSMLYGNTPTIDVSRRYSDPADDIGRIAAEAMERLLNLDAAENGNQIDNALQSALSDRLLPGLGVARVRYEADIREVTISEEMQAPDGTTIEAVTEERLVNESAPIEYWFWGDVLWGWARHWDDVPWLAYRNFLTKDEVEEQFGEEAANNLQFKRQTASVEEDGTVTDTDIDDNAWQKAEVWEIWDKKTRKVVYVSLGYKKVLKTKDDPLNLSGFFPSPEFFMANQTTSLYMPRPDFKMAEDLYNEIDILQNRITVITRAVRVVGVYDQSAEGIARMFDEGVDNKLIPVDNWALFGEKGGVAGQIDWVPIQDVVNSLDKLRELRAENIQLLQQVTGMADIMRGELSNQYEGVGQSQMKAKFGSVRMQALQDQFAKFASDLMQIKAEVIGRHYSPETIIKKANMQNTFDGEENQNLLVQAVELIKQPDNAHLRIAIRPESMAMVDFAQMQQERTSYITALSTFLQSSAPLIEQNPAATPFLLQLLQWGLAGFKGSSEIEGVIDKAVEQAEKATEQQQGQPSQAEIEAQTRNAENEQKFQQEMAKEQQKHQNAMEQRAFDKQADIETAYSEHEMNMREIEANMVAKNTEIQAKMEADIITEQVQAESNIRVAQANADAEIQKDVVNTELEIEKETAKTANRITEIAQSSAAKMREMMTKPLFERKTEKSEGEDDAG